MNEKDKKESDQLGEENKTNDPPPQEGKDAPFQEEIRQLRQELEAKEAEAKENYDRYLRQVADLDNFKKRTLRDKEETIKYSNDSFIRDLLPVLDNLERAVEHARGDGDEAPLLEGIEMVLKGLLDALGKHGVSQITSKGEIFNPEKHEALTQVESDQHEPNTVVEEFQKGYYLLDRLVRPSLVSVAKSPESKGESDQRAKVENSTSDD